jgi:hypothetical protein
MFVPSVTPLARESATLLAVSQSKDPVLSVCVPGSLMPRSKGLKCLWKMSNGVRGYRCWSAHRSCNSTLRIESRRCLELMQGKVVRSHSKIFPLLSALIREAQESVGSRPHVLGWRSSHALQPYPTRRILVGNRHCPENLSCQALCKAPGHAFVRRLTCRLVGVGRGCGLVSSFGEWKLSNFSTDKVFLENRLQSRT